MASNALSFNRSQLAIVAGFCALMLQGCATGDAPKVEPKPEATVATKPVPLSTIQRQDTKLKIQFDWWKLLRFAPLNALIEQTFAAYPEIDGVQQALLNLRQADISRWGYFQPVVTVKAVASGTGHVLLPQDAAPADDAKFIGASYYGVRVWQLEVGYLPEMLYLQQPSESSKTLAEIERLRLEASYRTLADNLIACVIQQAALREQMSAARKIIAIESSLLSLARRSAKAGSGEVELRQQALSSGLAALHRLEEQFSQVREAMHLLLNIPSADNLPDALTFSALRLTVAPPLELPSTLIDRRPDVRAAQSEMLPANDKYQVAVAAALKNVENCLFAIYSDGIALHAANDWLQDSEAGLALAQQRYAQHQAGYREVLIASQEVQFAVLSAVQARARQLGNAVVLYHALGAGWWEMNDQLRLEVDKELKKQLLH